MNSFPEVEQAFRERFGFAPEMPCPANLEAWAEVLKQCRLPITHSPTAVPSSARPNCWAMEPRRRNCSANTAGQ